MHGIGDNINQRYFVKTLTAQGRTVYLKTPLLEIYSDILGVKFVKADSPMRTQDRNERQTQETFVRGLSGVPGKRMFYDNSHMQRGSLFDAVAGQFGVGPSWLDLLHFQLPDLKLPAGRPVELIHPTTEREKWHNTAAARSINILIILSACDFYIISVADLLPGVEWIPDMEPYADLHLHHGELTIPQLLALPVCFARQGTPELAGRVPMTDRRDDDFRVRPSAPRNRGKGQNFVSRMLKQAGKANGGKSAARFAGVNLSSMSRRVTIKTLLVNH